MSSDSPSERKIAYFSMEVGIDARIPTYSGGLGVLAGDFLKAAADNEVPILGVTLLSRGGYFFQKVEGERQVEVPVSWRVDDFLEPVDEIVEVEIKDRVVKVTAWKYTIEGVSGGQVPVLFLDTDLEENKKSDRALTNDLYGNGLDYRLKQEIVLGVGGLRLLEKLGFDAIEHYHLNEGHSSFLCLELARQLGSEEEVRELCNFTTHTPVPAGHDKFPMNDVEEAINTSLFKTIPSRLAGQDNLNMTELALEMSGYINGVAKKHAQVSRSMFPNYPIHSITNGVHARTWISDSFQTLFDSSLPGWREDPSVLRAAAQLDDSAVWEAHRKEKEKALDYVNTQSNAGFDYDYLTLCWARRFTSYKRPLLFFEDLDRLKKIANQNGPLQVVYAGKAHPNDTAGKELIEEIVALSEQLNGELNLVYLENYDIELAKMLTAGVDVWLNTPLPPHEASGTSGMKCALNGVPQLSVLDGWWLEGWVEGETGWSLQDSQDVYQKLTQKIVPTFYNQPQEWKTMMKQVIALNGSFFNASRMVQEYLQRAYR
ncbi:MAG: alpha-glucan family phosphorylase [Patescibacteria group bacterium]